MLLSKEFNFLFFKVSKTASTTVEQALPSAGGSTSSKELKDFWKNFSEVYDTVSGREHPEIASHVNIQIVKHHNILPDAVLSRLTKFCFVRNPWDRMVSEFHARQQGESNSQGFDEFIRAIPETINQNQFFTDFEYYNKVEHFIPQYDYVFDAEGNQIIDFVGRYENLREDFDTAFRKVYGRERDNNAINHRINKTNHDHYSVYYTEELKNIVAKIYAKDIEKFEYSFDDTPDLRTETERIWEIDKN
tara:strand:+ start:176 stop:916 length:741 start_codon:yes stop_codon:yes gene_type:complete